MCPINSITPPDEGLYMYIVCSIYTYIHIYTYDKIHAYVYIYIHTHFYVYTYMYISSVHDITNPIPWPSPTQYRLRLYSIGTESRTPNYRGQQKARASDKYPPFYTYSLGAYGRDPNRIRQGPVKQGLLRTSIDGKNPRSSQRFVETLGVYVLPERKIRT